jgi:DNA polymerase-1
MEKERTDAMAEKIVLIDGNSIINRAFYGIPDLTNAEGKHTNAVYGFLNILFKILDEEKPEYLLVAFDVKHPTFRHEMYPEYKGTRKPMPEELREQVPLLKEVLSSMGIVRVELPGYEADDILGTIAKQSEEKGIDVSLISGDRDMLQLATDKIKIRIPKTKKGGTEIEDYYTKAVLEKYSVTPEQIIDLKGLMGDSSDNIPGVPGIGEKGATKIIGQFGSVENAIAHLDEVTPPKAKKALAQHCDLARLSKELATIHTSSPVVYELNECRLGNLYTKEAYSMIKRLEFKSMLTRFSQEEIQEKEDEFKKNIHVVTDLQEAEEVFLRIGKKAGEPKFSLGISICEEEGWFYGISFSFGEKETWVLKNDGMFLSESFLLKRLQPILEGSCETAVLSMKELFPVLEEGGMDLEAVVSSGNFDLSLAAYLCNPLKAAYEPEDIANDYTGRCLLGYAERFGKQKKKEAADREPEKFGEYMAELAYEAWLDKPVLEKKLLETGMMDLYKKVELPLTLTLYEMEKRGILVNAEELKKYGEELSEKIVILEKEIYELAGETFNINSPKQLGVILFEKLELPFGKKTKTGYSTSADILEKLRSKHPLVDKVLEYRQLAKLKSTYADGLAAFISKQDGRIHGKFHQTITATGRISSTEPNLQNIPIRMEIGRQIRKVFIPKEGFVFLDADYSQIELRVLAHMSGDEKLIEAYKNAQDIHALTASQVFHVPLDEVTPLQRRNAKAVNFGIVYGISSFGLGQDLNITKKEAEAYMEQYFASYPKIKEFLDGLVADAKKNGYALTLFGRRRPVPELSSGNYMQRSFGERIAMNSPIQGTAADIIKIAMNEVNQALKEGGLKSRLLLQIHDELLVETAEDEVETVKEILKEKMEGAAKLLVPLSVDVQSGGSWYEAH